MKVVAFNGSAHKQGNTFILVRTALEELERAGIETEVVSLTGKPIAGCRACFKCFDNTDKHCAFKNDLVNDCIDKMVAADGIIIASPTYFADVSAETKAIIDRCGMVARANDSLYARKVGAAIVAVRRGGAIHAFDTINHFFTISEMIVVGSSYWNIGIGNDVGEVAGDEEGLDTMRTLGRNMAWLLGKLNR